MRFLLALALFIAAAPARALSYRPMTPQQVADESADVFIARVVAATDEVAATGALSQRLTLQVLDRWKGNGPSLVVRHQVVKVADAEAPGRLFEIPGNPLVQVGQTYLFFLRSDVSPPRVPLTVAGEAGLFRAERVRGHWLLRHLDGRPVLGVTAERVLFAPGEAAPGAQAVTQWRAVVAPRTLP